MPASAWVTAWLLTVLLRAPLASSALPVDRAEGGGVDEMVLGVHGHHFGGGLQLRVEQAVQDRLVQVADDDADRATGRIEHRRGEDPADVVVDFDSGS